MGEETRRKKLEIRNGEWEREGASRIGRRRWFCWCAGIPTRGSAWKRWRLVEAVPMKQGTRKRKPGEAGASRWVKVQKASGGIGHLGHTVTHGRDLLSPEALLDQEIIGYSENRSTLRANTNGCIDVLVTNQRAEETERQRSKGMHTASKKDSDQCQSHLTPALLSNVCSAMRA